METRVLARQEAEAIASRPESHFWDFKSKRIDGKKFQQTVVAMLNADGGEVAVGIENPVGVPAAPLDLWDGFAVPEETNPLVQTALQEIEPVPLVELSYLTIAGMEKTLPHEPLAHPEDAVLEYLKNHPTIDNKTGRQLTGIRSENAMKDVFYRLRDRGLIKLKPAGGASSWRRTTDAEQAEHNKKSTEKKRRAPRPARK